MTKADWLTVAMVAAVIISAIATLLAPVLAVYVQSRISQERPRPAPAQLGNVIQKVWRFADLKRTWPYFVSMAINLCVSLYGFHRAKHTVDRWSIMLIVVGAAAYLGFGLLFINSTNMRELRREIDELKASRVSKTKRTR